MIANALDTLYPLSGLLKRKRVDQKDAMVLYDSRVMETTPYGIYEHICRFDELKLNGPTKEQQNEVAEMLAKFMSDNLDNHFKLWMDDLRKLTDPDIWHFMGKLGDTPFTTMELTKDF